LVVLLRTDLDNRRIAANGNGTMKARVRHFVCLC
jgi:hypothetical protein